MALQVGIGAIVINVPFSHSSFLEHVGSPTSLPRLSYKHFIMNVMVGFIHQCGFFTYNVYIKNTPWGEFCKGSRWRGLVVLILFSSYAKAIQTKNTLCVSAPLFHPPTSNYLMALTKRNSKY